MTIREIVYKFRDNGMSYDWLIDELNNYRLQIKAEIMKELPKEKHTEPNQCSSADIYTNFCKADYVFNDCLSQVKEAIDKLLK